MTQLFADAATWATPDCTACNGKGTVEVPDGGGESASTEYCHCWWKNQPLDLDAVRARYEYYLAHRSSRSCPAHPSADDIPALLAEVTRDRVERDRLRAQVAELTARCHNCGHHKTDHNLTHHDCGGQVVMRLDCRCHRYAPSPEES